MKINPASRDMRMLLETSFYKIPRFQRPYSWDRENVDDFWNDSIASTEAEYFIGSMVGYRKDEHDDTFSVVDGQQRLTTVTLLLAAIRNAFNTHGFTQLAIGLHKFVEKANINADMKYVLQSETPYPYLQEHIQKFGDPELPPELGSEEEAIRSAFEYLTDKIADAVQVVRDDPTIATISKKDKIKEQLIKIRDRVLKLRVIFIEMDDEDNAYLIFETLNTRGKDLTVADLVKNYLTRLLKPGAGGVDVTKD